jgi:hypothetical protein
LTLIVDFALACEQVFIGERLWLLGFIGQVSGSLAHVELAGDDLGNQAGAVLAEEVDFALRTRFIMTPSVAGSR